MGLERVWTIPICHAIFTIGAFVISYLLASASGHIDGKIWPYISDSGTLPPESCVFGQLLNLSALFLAITVYLRHRQIVEFYWHYFKKTGCWRTTSCVILWLGYASAFGISMVANFQESNVLLIHYAGAFLAFGCGLVYSWAQTIFSYKMNPKLADPLVSNFRFLLCLFATFFFFLTLIFGIIGRHNKSTECCACVCQLYKWTTHEENYVAHSIATIGEWCLAICFEIYILSFAIELRHAYCHAPKLKLMSTCLGKEEIASTATSTTTSVPKAMLASIRPPSYTSSNKSSSAPLWQPRHSITSDLAPIVGRMTMAEGLPRNNRQETARHGEFEAHHPARPTAEKVGQLPLRTLSSEDLRVTEMTHRGLTRVTSSSNIASFKRSYGIPGVV